MDSDHAKWARDTWGGRLNSFVPQPDQAAEAAAAKVLADDHEMTYGQRPPLPVCLAKVRQGSTGTTLTGEAGEIVDAIRYKFPDMPIKIVSGPEPAGSLTGGLVTSPGQAPQPVGDPGMSGMLAAQLARRR